MKQTTDALLLVRPRAFRANEETIGSNHFQSPESAMAQGSAEQLVEKEFNNLLNLLTSKGIEIVVGDYDEEINTPDRLFPNNWVSFHEDGTAILYPMLAANRRRERRPEILNQLRKKGFEIRREADLTHLENEGVFLEGTGSMVLDRVHRVAYACLSERTHPPAVIEFCKQFDYEPCLFHAFHSVNNQRLPIYHTNVMMSIGVSTALICAKSIDDEQERNRVISSLERSRHVIHISEKQVDSFAGNMLEVHSKTGEQIMVMSTRAYLSLDTHQKEGIQRHCSILHTPLDTIEKLGGGSARCMMAEIFLPRTS